MLKRQRTIAIILVFAFTLVALAGCSPNPNAMPKLDENNAGFWDRYFVIPLSHLLDWGKEELGNYGWSIVVVTLLIRIVIFPLVWKQQKSAQAMQQIQPKVLKLREKYKDKPEKQQQEMMKLFQESGVNPMAGCLPMLIQFPILIAFYQAIMGNPHISDSSFLYMQLGQPDPYYILPVLAAVTTYIQLIVSGVNSNPQMKMMLGIMPIMILVFAVNFPSALSLYWVFGNIFTIIQYAIIPKPDKGNDTKQKTQKGATR